MTATATNRSRRAASLAAPILGLAAVAITAGCSNYPHWDTFRATPTPVMDTPGESHVEIQNAVTISYDTNFRQMNSDIGRLMFTDRPTRLTPHPNPF